MPWKILAQFPRMAFTIYTEHKWLKQIVKEYHIDAVISDNRFGMYHKTIPSVYITHQLLIKTGNRFTERIAQRIHYFFIRKYKECWVPDFKVNGLAGVLSHPKKLPKKIRYLGALSRFEVSTVEKKYDVLISISGPEPQRAIFEEKILNHLRSFTGTALLIRGLPENSNELKYENPMITIKNHLSGKELNKAILESDIIISRCGYTTIMDLTRLKKNGILVPTPGQTEQEYLARRLKKRRIFYTINQKDFVLENILRGAHTFQGIIPEYNMEKYKNVIDQFVRSL